MQLITEMKTHKLVFKDEERKPIYLTADQSDKVKQKWIKKINPVEIGDHAFLYIDIKEIIKISSEELSSLSKNKKHDLGKIEKKDNENWKRWFIYEFEEYKKMEEFEKELFRKNNKFRSFQYDYMISFSESTLRERNAALASCIIEENRGKTPQFILNFAKK